MPFKKRLIFYLHLAVGTTKNDSTNEGHYFNVDLNKQLRFAIPEQDYGRITTLKALAIYILDKKTAST